MAFPWGVIEKGTRLFTLYKIFSYLTSHHTVLIRLWLQPFLPILDSHSYILSNRRSFVISWFHTALLSAISEILYALPCIKTVVLCVHSAEA